MSLAEKFVYATTDFNVAIFVATIWRRAGASGWTTSGISDKESGYIFHASEAAKQEAAKPDNFGFVYVLDKTNFKTDTHNPYEMVSAVRIRPYAIVRVNAFDLKPDFRTLTPPRTND